MLENHSFDQMLGSLSAVYKDLDGIDPNSLRSNPDYPDATKMIFQSETRLTSISLDPAHEFVNVNHQLANGGTGFVRDYAQADPNCTDEEKAQIMAYYPLDFSHGISPCATDGFRRCPAPHGRTVSSCILALAKAT
jgi:phospholipase C